MIIKSAGKKKLLIATDSFLPRWDGIARFLSDTIPELKDDYDITVLAPNFSGEKKDISGVTVVRVPILKFSIADINPAMPMMQTIKKYVRKSDIVWVHTMAPIGIHAIKYAKQMGKPVISYVHSIEWELYPKSMAFFTGLIYFITKLTVRKYYNKCDLIMVPSLEVKELFEFQGIKARKRIVQLGINTDKFKPADNKELAKESVKIEPGMKVIGFCSRIGREKDLMTLYRAFMRLDATRKDLLLLVIGKGVKKQEMLLRKKSNIRLVGSTDNVIPYLQAMDIYVLPSLTETSSLSTMEAMACGLPVVVTPVGLVKQYIKDKENGCFFPKKNDLVLSLKLDWLLKNRQMALAFGFNARRTIINRFQWKKTVEEVKETLRFF